MIHIDLDGKKPPTEWIKKAETITRQLNDAASSEKRHAIINKNRKVWGEIKKCLLKYSHNKCWYTEARSDSSYFEVEHFRPKKWDAKKDDSDFEGYWWLAFEWKNYRVCGSAPNRKKGTFFPIHEDSRRATSRKRHLVEDEIHALLDPLEIADPPLISFDERGICKPTPGTEGWERHRADTSIERYGLNNLPQLCEGRQRVWRDCRKLIDDLDELHAKNATAPTVACRTRIKEKTGQLINKMKSDQAFSAVARTCTSVCGYYWARGLAQT